MRLFVLLSLLSSAASATPLWSAQGSGTHIDSVKPQNCTDSGPSYCTDLGGVVFPYADNNYAVMTAWSGGVAVPIAGNERMLIFGGGHVINFDNSVYSINLFDHTASALSTPSITAGSSSPVTVSNVTCDLNPDGTPRAIHSYGQIVWLATSQRLWLWDMAYNTYCGSGAVTPPTNNVYLFDALGAKTWSIKNNSGTIGLSTSQLAVCAEDTSHGVTANETVICLVVFGGGRALVRHNMTTNVWTTLWDYTDAKPFPYTANMAIDPARKLAVMIGSTAESSGSLAVVTVDLSNTSYTVTDISGSVTGCSALNIRWPGLSYDNVTGGGNFMAWPNAGNTVYEFNPSTLTCIVHTASGGPPSPTNATAGTFGRFAAYPSLGGFVVADSTTGDAYLFTLGGTGSSHGATAAFGGSSVH